MINSKYIHVIVVVVLCVINFIKSQLVATIIIGI